MRSVSYTHLDVYKRQGVVDADVLHSLQLTRAFGENDPLKIIGAAKVKELVWHDEEIFSGSRCCCYGIRSYDRMFKYIRRTCGK